MRHWRIENWASIRIYTKSDYRFMDLNLRKNIRDRELLRALIKS